MMSSYCDDEIKDKNSYLLRWDPLPPLIRNCHLYLFEVANNIKGYKNGAKIDNGMQGCADDDQQ